MNRRVRTVTAIVGGRFPSGRICYERVVAIYENGRFVDMAWIEN